MHEQHQRTTDSIVLVSQPRHHDRSSGGEQRLLRCETRRTCADLGGDGGATMFHMFGRVVGTSVGH